MVVKAYTRDGRLVLGNVDVSDMGTARFLALRWNTSNVTEMIIHKIVADTGAVGFVSF